MNRKSSPRSTGPKTVSIPERQAILDYLGSMNKPVTLQRIAEDHGVTGKSERKILGKRLRAMQRDGQVIKNRKEGYGLVEKMDLLTGTIIGHPDGFGFMKPDKGGKDLFLPPREMRGVLHGDRIIARLVGFDKRGRPEGAIVEVLTRANKQLVGRYYREDNVGFVVPENRKIHQDILIGRSKKNHVKSGQYVQVEITHQPDRHTQPVGNIIEILGDKMSANLAVDIAVRSFEIPAEWSEEVMNEAGKYSSKIKIREDEQREDLRELPLVTIDGEDARDFDDAVFCQPQGSGWRLLVAIADVSQYVRPGSALDQEALTRGNSVYFPQKVIPMLPEVLSNGLCSLKPEVDRLCQVCELNVNKQGIVKHYRFFEAVMRSAARLTYTEVASILLNNDKSLNRKYSNLIPHLNDLYRLFEVMHHHRESQALIDFDALEASFEFSKEGKIKHIHVFQRNDAHRLIEEFMLAANVAAAEYLLKNNETVLFRVHASPNQEKLDGLRTLLGEVGLSLGGGADPTARDYAKLLDEIKNREDKHLIEMVLLRSMPLAIYSDENIGHFGLAFPAYTHFTSPIRRYPDLLVHRAIKKNMKFLSSDNYPYTNENMHQFGEHCSMTERRADEATRDVEQWYKCEYMSTRIGEEFEGTISSVTSFGLFVELDDIFIEGLVHITGLPVDYYHYDPVGHRLKGERTGCTYRLANRVRVKLVRVDMDDRKIDFELLE